MTDPRTWLFQQVLSCTTELLPYLREMAPDLHARLVPDSLTLIQDPRPEFLRHPQIGLVLFEGDTLGTPVLVVLVLLLLPANEELVREELAELVEAMVAAAGRSGTPWIARELHAIVTKVGR